MQQDAEKMHRVRLIRRDFENAPVEEFGVVQIALAMGVNGEGERLAES